MLNIGIIFGGKSGEYDVSLMSAYNVIKAIDKDKFKVTLIGITLDGKWYIYDGDEEKIKDNSWIKDKKNLNGDFSLFNDKIINDIDVFFPVLHGQYCEDGKIQGVFEIMDKAYVGCNVMTSAVCMDKDIAKRIFKSVGIPVVEDYVVFKKDLMEDIKGLVERIVKKLGLPLFVKPVNMGSSVGINKAHDKEELESALLYASKFDTKILVEKAINAREIETAVLGNEDIKVSYPGEVVSCKEFYDYEAKYLSDDDSKVMIPADIPDELIEKLRNYAATAFEAVSGRGLSRIDFFLDKDDGSVYLNEINTMPGFTNISMYPKMMEHIGISYNDLITKLIDLALEEYKSKHDLVVKEN